MEDSKERGKREGQRQREGIVTSVVIHSTAL